jgi:hypothetical protein
MSRNLTLPWRQLFCRRKNSLKKLPSGYADFIPCRGHEFCPDEAVFRKSSSRLLLSRAWGTLTSSDAATYVHTYIRTTLPTSKQNNLNGATLKCRRPNSDRQSVEKISKMLKKFKTHLLYSPLQVLKDSQRSITYIIDYVGYIRLVFFPSFPTFFAPPYL